MPEEVTSESTSPETEVTEESAVPEAEAEEVSVTDADVAPEETVSEPEVAPESPAEKTASKNTEPAPAKEAAEEEDAEEEEPEEELINPVPDDGIPRRWYAIHAHSGQEANVRKSINAVAIQQGLDNLIPNVFVPMEDVAEFKSGEKKVSKRKYFPGYVLVQLPEHPEKYPELWHLIKDTPGVTGFIGSKTEPVPLEDSEVNAIIEEIRGERERPRPKVSFDMNERVKIIDGPFSNFLGNIGEVNEERGKLKVMVEIFERQTSVEVEFWQVEKI